MAADLLPNSRPRNGEAERSNPAGQPAPQAGDRVARLASLLTQAPCAIVTQVVGDRHSLEGSAGLPEPWATRRELPPFLHALCRQVVASNGALAVEDARSDPRCHDWPEAGERGMTACLAVPLSPLGTGVLAVAAPQPRAWSEAETAALRDLAATAGPERVSPRPTDGAAAPDEEATALLAGLPDACLVLAEEGRLTYLSSHAEHLFRQLAQCEPADLLGQNLWEKCPEVADSTLARQCRRARAEQRPVEAETYYPAFRRWFAVQVVPSRGRLCVFFRDVSERARLDGALRQRVEELAAADRGKVEFLTQLAHEVRNALAPVRTALHLATIAPPDADLERACDLAGQEIRRLGRLLDDLLRVAELLPGQLVPKFERVNLAALLAQTLQTALTTPEAGGRRITVELPPEPLWFEGDPRLLGQALAHLLNNAVQFTRPGGQISLTAGRQGDEVLLRVRDDGAGISPDLLPHVFNLFMRAERGLDPTQGGIGVGLTLVRHLVELHGGTVEGRSEGPGRGSEFVVRLPAPAESLSSGGSAADGPGDGRPRVLVVDDSVEAAQSIRLLVRRWGYDVRVVYDGASGVEVARAWHPQAVILDIGMPGMNGYEVARRLRAAPARDDLVVVALTGYGGEEDRRNAREAGFDYHLVKPVDPGDLRELLALATPSVRPAHPGPG